MNTTERRRRRNISACDLCRSRRIKCDGSRPRCSTCSQRNAACVYPEVVEAPKSRLEIEMSTIRHRLDSIMKLLFSENAHRSFLADMAPVTVPISSWTREQNGRTDMLPEEGLKSSSTPFMVIQNLAVMDLLGLKQDLAQQMVDAERAIVPMFSSSSIEEGDLHFSKLGPNSAIDAFFDKIYVWYPILGFKLREDLLNVQISPTAASERCLYLIVVAIGSLAQYDSLQEALRQRPDALWIEKALGFLPTVLLESSVKALQCLIFLSIYYLCLVKPCQAHDYILIASIRAQDLLKRGNLDAETQELVRCAFWATFLIESELSIQLDLASSGLLVHESEIPLPSWSQIGDEGTSSPSDSTEVSPAPSSSNSEFPSRHFTYLLAEISMRRMLQRCTISTRKLPCGKRIFAPAIAAELELQLEQWHSYLPEFLSFGLDYVADCTSAPQLLFLQTQYHAYRATISWPAVYQVIEEGQLDDMLRLGCLGFYRSYSLFILSAASCIPQCPPNTWTLYASVFIITMAALRGTESLSLSSFISLEVLKSFDIACQLLEQTGELGPSLQMMQGILTEALANMWRNWHALTRRMLEQQ